MSLRVTVADVPGGADPSSDTLPLLLRRRVTISKRTMPSEKISTCGVVRRSRRNSGGR